MVQWQLFIAFFRVGMLGYGGGPSAIPLIHKEVVGNYKWMDNDEFSDVLALANTLPGPIATKLAGYIGYRVAGMIGMMSALVATMVPTIFIMIVLLTSLSSFKNQGWVSGMTKAVVPVVGVMLAVLTWESFYKAKVDLGFGKTIALTVTSFVVMQFLGIHPGIVIATILLFIFVYPNKKRKYEQQVKGGTNK